MCDYKECDKAFKFNRSLTHHVNAVHLNLGHTCKRDCGSVLTTKQTILRHESDACRLRSNEEKEAAKVVCGLGGCTTRVSTQSSLRGHQKLHHECKGCNNVLPVGLIIRDLEHHLNIDCTAPRTDADVRRCFKCVLECYPPLLCNEHPDCKFFTYADSNYNQHLALHKECIHVDRGCEFKFPVSRAGGSKGVTYDVHGKKRTKQNAEMFLEHDKVRQQKTEMSPRANLDVGVYIRHRGGENACASPI